MMTSKNSGIKNRLAITTALVVSMIGYGRRAYAACEPSTPPEYICSGENTTSQVIFSDNATVITEEGFSVLASGTGSEGITIYGAGDLSFTDEFQSSIVSTNSIGLFIQTPITDAASITVVSDGEIKGGGATGILAVNRGRGALSITVSGEVSGTGRAIDAYNLLGDSLDITVEEGGDIDGRIYSRLGVPGAGTGSHKITILGEISGVGVSAVEAYSRGGAEDLIIVTGAASSITGGNIGILAKNAAQNTGGATEVTVNGDVTSLAGAAVEVDHYNSGAVKVATGTGSSLKSAAGILANNNGRAGMTLNIDGGKIEGTLFDGIMAYNNNAFGSYGATYLTVNIANGATVEGAVNGATISNNGSGDTKITIDGDVTGGSAAGIYARSYGADLTVTTGAQSNISTGKGHAINAINYGSGILEVTVHGAVTGGAEDAGIATTNATGSETRITVGAAAIVEGERGSIRAYSLSDQTITIINAGEIRTTGGASDSDTIVTGGPTILRNSGLITGAVLLSPEDDRFHNSGSWNMSGGFSVFGDGEDRFENSGTFLAADDEISKEPTLITDLEHFSNSGLVTLVNGHEGDVLDIRGPVSFVGEGGRLAVDVNLAPGNMGVSDLLVIGGDTSGSTRVQVNVVGFTGANDVGIPVVEVTGTSAEEHFNLDAPLITGFFIWDLRYDENNGWHELFTSGVGVGAYEFAAGITGAQEIWHQTTGTLLQRQADLRALLDGISVTPVADYAEPVEPTPTARVTPGFWFKGVGAYIERDDEEFGFSLDREQAIWGGMAGFDSGHQDAGSAWLYGIFAGYLTSDLDFKETNSEWSYEGPTVGAYVTYLDHGFYADVVVKADFLDIEIDPADAPDDADTDATNIGGRIDTGYKFGERIFIEPQATLAVVHTEIDDVEVFDSAIEFDDETSVRGRLGLRLGFDQPASDGTVYSGDLTASVWEEFSGDNDVTVAETFGASDDSGGTYGDVSLGFSVAAPAGWSAFIRGNYLFAGDYEAITGNAGVRYAW